MNGVQGHGSSTAAKPFEREKYWTAKQDDWIERINKTQNPFMVVAGLVLTSTFTALTTYDEDKMCPGNPAHKVLDVLLAELHFY